MFHDITHNNAQEYLIDTPGDHIFFFYNKNGHINFKVSHPKARLFMFGLFIGKEDQKFSFSTRQQHAGTNTSSQAIVHSILYDEAQLELQGNITLEKNAPAAKASYSNKNLLMGEKAYVSSQPALDILNHDVECSHSATTSRPNDDQLLYMQLRSISQQEAEELYTQGFILSLFEQMKKMNIKTQPLIHNYLPDTLSKTIL